MEITERARRYLARMEASVSGSGGHNALFAAACALAKGFDLPEDLALRLLAEDFNPRCAPPWSERELRHKVKQAAKSDGEAGFLLKDKREAERAQWVEKKKAETAAVGPERENKRREFDAGALGRMMLRGFTPTYQYFAERSPVDPRRCTPAEFLGHVFEQGDRGLVFYRFTSQGEFGWFGGRLWRLGARPGIAPEKVEALPGSGRVGAWFLPNPVDGKWYPSGKVDARGNPVLSRRTGDAITAWRYMLLESDDAPEDQWMALMAQLPFPITALYTSGGRSIHALVRIEAKSKGAFDAFRDRVVPFLSRVGADPAAISGVRLTRIPGVIREGTMTKENKYFKYDEPRLQRLIFLNPQASVEPIMTMRKLRMISNTGERKDGDHG